MLIWFYKLKKDSDMFGEIKIKKEMGMWDGIQETERQQWSTVVVLFFFTSFIWQSAIATPNTAVAPELFDQIPRHT